MIGEFITMTRYMSGQNKMVVSNMGWLPKYDDHAIFLLKRYGIKNVELIPTKYGKWEDIFHNSVSMTKKYEINGIRICKRVKPTSISKIGSEKYVREVLKDVQWENPGVLMCLEPNSSAYGCSIGNDLQSCIRMAKSGFYVNFDTGNFSMENDTMKDWDDDCIKHCQISAPFLRPVHYNDYMKMLDKTESDLPLCFEKIKNNDSMISLECKVDKIEHLGGYIQDFASFVAKVQN